MISLIVWFISIIHMSKICGIVSLNVIATISRSQHPQVIGHAGASGYVPESTLIGYNLAANLDADYSEPDLILTMDGEFIAMHDLTLEGTTNVLEFPEYENRKATFVIEGKAITGYYAINFTLAEIKSLRVRQRFDTRTTLFDWLFQVPTLDEIINWQLNIYNTTNRLVGIYPELKHPDWYNEMGYPMEDLLLEKLSMAGYLVSGEDTPRDLRSVVPVAIQCFKSSSLRYLAQRTNIPLVQLLGISAEAPTPDLVYNQKVLDAIMTYASAVAPDKKIFSTDMGTSVSKAMEMRKWAFDRNLYFIPWSFQQEEKYIPLQFNGDSVAELQFYYGCLQSSAIFHEFPDRAREVLDSCPNVSENKTNNHQDMELHRCFVVCKL